MTPFSEQLRTATWPEHQRAEASPFLISLMSGRAGINGYAALVVQHYFAYQVLEDAAAVMRSDPVAGPFILDELHRLPALELDLAAVVGPDWRSLIAPSLATVAYCERLRDVCYTWPGGFVAHHYTRYLGDLSGGQIIRRAIQRGLAVTNGFAFYDFSRLGDLTAFKVRYRQALDTAPWDADERTQILNEVRLAYQHNTAVLHGLHDPRDHDDRALPERRS